MEEIFLGLNIVHIIQLFTVLAIIVLIFFDLWLINEYLIGEEITHMIMNAKLILDNNPELSGLNDLFGVEERYDSFDSRMDNFNKNPDIIKVDRYQDTFFYGFVASILVLLLSPFFVLWIFYTEFISKGFHICISDPPALRSRRFIINVVALLINLVLFVVGNILFNNSDSVLSLIGTLLMILAILTSFPPIILLVINIKHQIRWKDFWKKELFKLMINSSVNNNLDLYTRAKLSYDVVENKPSLLLTKQMAIIASILGFINLTFNILLM